MNHFCGIGRLTKDPDIKVANNDLKIARYTLAIDRMKDGTDFISCVAFGKSAEFAEKYLNKGMKIAIEGRIQTGSYDKNGQKFYTTDIIVDRHEFCERKGESAAPSAPDDVDSFMNIPEGIDDEMPFGK